MHPFVARAISQTHLTEWRGRAPQAKHSERWGLVRVKTGVTEVMACALLQTTERLHEGWQDDVPVTHHTVARLAKNVRVGVLVDGHNRLGS